MPWRGLIEPLISLPPRVFAYCLCTSPLCNRLHQSSVLTQASLEEMLENMSFVDRTIAVRPTLLIVSPQIRHLIDTNHAVREAARLVGVRGL